LSVLIVVLAFLAMLTVLVGIHEAGHAIVARMCGARVTEFFIGMPFGPEVSYTSRRSGIKYGATLALLGGYTKISGMLPLDDRRAALVLALVNARGRVTVEEAARVLGCGCDDAVLLLAALAEWGSIEEDWPQGSRHGRRDYPAAYRTPARDARGLTVLDRGHDFSLPGSTAAGEPFFPAVSADAFLELERGRTYCGLSVPKRLAVLVAGVACNLALAFLVFVLYYMLHGVPVLASLDVAAVSEGSVAAQAGMVEGDRIVSVAGHEVEGYDHLGTLLEEARGTGPFVLAYSSSGEVVEATVELGEGEMLGVEYAVAMQGLRFSDAARVSLAYMGAYAQAVMSLLNPTEAGEVLENSAGVVGIASMTQDAVEAGLWSVLTLLGMLSLSLGWMNLLPVPPLDGGKVVVEVVQLVLRRPVSVRVQNAVSLVGMALFLTLFFYMVAQDVTRLMGM